MDLEWEARTFSLARVEGGHEENLIKDNADMNRRFNNLLVEFSHCDSGILSTLFKTYCVNIIMDVKRGDM